MILSSGSTPQFSSHTSRKFVVRNSLRFNGYGIRGPVRLSRSNTALDEPRINQSNCEFVASYAITLQRHLTLGILEDRPRTGELGMIS